MKNSQVIMCPKDVANVLNQVIREKNATRILIITGKNLYKLTGAETAIASSLGDLQVSVFQYTNPNPKLDDVTKCIAFAKETKPEVIIGIGGGTAMDIAKIVHVLLSNPGDLREYVLKEKTFSSEPSTVLIQIPTTTGSGSEITQFAVIYIEGKKYSLDHLFLTADYCLIDPQFTLSMPFELVVITALDALCQAIESAWSIHSTSESFDFSKSALLIHSEILRNLSDRPSFNARKELLLASHYAGKAINITRTTAAHALSYSLTSRYGIPHGHAVAITISEFLKFNYDVTVDDVQDKRGVEHVRKRIKEIIEVLGCRNIDECSTWIKSVMASAGLQVRLRDLDVPHTEIESHLVSGFDLVRGKNNPRMLSTRDIASILKVVW